MYKRKFYGAIHTILECPTYPTTIKKHKNKNIIEILDTSNHKDIRLLKTALTKAKICQNKEKRKQR